MTQKPTSSLSRLAPLLASALAVLLFFAITTPPARSQSMAKIRTTIAVEYSDASSHTVEYLNNDMRMVQRSGADLLKDDEIEVTTLVTLAKILLCLVASLVFWFLLHFLFRLLIGESSGRQQSDKNSETILEAEQLRVITQNNICQSKASLVGVPMPGKTDLGNLVFCGSPGSGKTVTLRDLLSSIRSSGKKAVVFDPNGELISYFYRPDTDIILNPPDVRSANWDIWSDCNRRQDYVTIAKNLIPEQDHHSNWVLGAQLVLAELARRESEQGSPSNDRLMKNIKAIEDDDVRDILKETEAATIIAEHGGEACYGIRGILIAALKPLEELDGTGSRLSVRRWAFNETNDSWLFISSHPSEQEALRPLTAVWMDLIFKTLMALQPDHLRRYFVIIDDLHALNRIQSLPDLMVQSRRLGVCTALGIQTIGKVRDVYGDEASKTMLRSCENIIGMRTSDSETMQWMAPCFGSRETLETIEVSYDGDQKKLHTERLLKMPLVTAEDFSELPELNGFIRFGHDYPAARFRGAAKALPMVADPFIPRSDKSELLGSALTEDQEEKEATPEPETSEDLNGVLNDSPVDEEENENNVTTAA